MFHKKQKILTPAQQEEVRTKDFFDCILPGVIRFHTDHYIVGDSYRCVWQSRGTTVRRALRDLRKADLIETEQRYRKNSAKSSLLYKLKPK